MADLPLPDARAWMVKAWRDLETARRVATGQAPFYDVAVYHCQQAAGESKTMRTLNTLEIRRQTLFCARTRVIFREDAAYR